MATGSRRRTGRSRQRPPEAARCDPTMWTSGFRGPARARVEDAARKTTPQLRQAGVMPRLGPNRQKWVRLPAGHHCTERLNPDGGVRRRERRALGAISAATQAGDTRATGGSVAEYCVQGGGMWGVPGGASRPRGRGQVVSAPRRRAGAWPPSPKPRPSEGRGGTVVQPSSATRLQDLGQGQVPSLSLSFSSVKRRQ